MASANRVRRPSIRSSCSISSCRNESFWMNVWGSRARTSSLNRLPHSLTTGLERSSRIAGQP